MSPQKLLLALGVSGNAAFFLLPLLPALISALFGPLSDAETQNVDFCVLPTQVEAILVMIVLGGISYHVVRDSRTGRLLMVALFLVPLFAGMVWMVLQTFASA